MTLETFVDSVFAGDRKHVVFYPPVPANGFFFRSLLLETLEETKILAIEVTKSINRYVRILFFLYDIRCESWTSFQTSPHGTTSNSIR